MTLAPALVCALLLSQAPPAEPEPAQASGQQAAAEPAAAEQVAAPESPAAAKQNPVAPLSNPPRPNTLTLNPLGLLRGELSIEYERAVWTRLSLFIAPQPTFLLTAGRLELGFLTEVGARFFLLGHAPTGLFIGPELVFALLRESASGQVQSTFAVGVGGMIGLTVILFDRLAVSGGLGARSLITPNTADWAGLPIVAVPRLAVGLAF